MKKKLLLTLFLFVNLISFSQSYKGAVGLKYNYSTLNFLVLEANGKYFFAKNHAIDVNLGISKRCFWSQVNYQFNYKIDDGLNWYAGGGFDTGIWRSSSGSRIRGLQKGDVWYGFNTLAGIEYTFVELPMNLAFDTGPSIQLYPNARFGWNISFTIRYAFK